MSCQHPPSVSPLAANAERRRRQNIRFGRRPTSIAMPCKCHVSPMLDAQPPTKWQPLARKIRNAEQNRLFPHFCCHHAGESVNKTDPRKEKDVVARDKVLLTSMLRRHTSAVSRSRSQSAKQGQRPDESDSRLQPGQSLEQHSWRGNEKSRPNAEYV
jgi:hypothetical protein